MHKILVIAVREYMAAVRSKAFIIGLLFMPVLMFGGIAVQSVLKSRSEQKEKHFGVADRTPGQELVPVLELAVKFRNSVLAKSTGKEQSPLSGAPFVIERITPSPDTQEAIKQQRFELSERVRRGQLDGFLEIGPDVEKPTVDPALAFQQKLPSMKFDERRVIRYQSNRPMSFEFSRWAEKVVSTAVQARRGLKGGLSLQDATSMIQPVPLESKGLSSRDSGSGAITEADDADPFDALLVPMSLTVLMLMMLMVGTSPLMQSVMEEKMQRIAEVLLGSVRPFDLMMGKLVGMVGVSLTSVTVYLGGAYLAAHRFGFDQHLSLSIIGWFVLFQVLGVVMYGSLFIAIGAACNDAKEVQSLLMPVMLVATAPIFAMPQILREPNSALSLGLSFFPFATPMIMTSRLANPPGIPVWQPALGVLLTLITTAGCVYAAGRIFRVGLLMQGKGAHISDLVKWVIKG